MKDSTSSSQFGAPSCWAWLVVVSILNADRSDSFTARPTGRCIRLHYGTARESVIPGTKAKQNTAPFHRRQPKFSLFSSQHKERDTNSSTEGQANELSLHQDGASPNEQDNLISVLGEDALPPLPISKASGEPTMFEEGPLGATDESPSTKKKPFLFSWIRERFRREDHEDLENHTSQTVEEVEYRLDRFAKDNWTREGESSDPNETSLPPTPPGILPSTDVNETLAPMHTNEAQVDDDPSTFAMDVGPRPDAVSENDDDVRHSNVEIQQEDGLVPVIEEDVLAPMLLAQDTEDVRGETEQAWQGPSVLSWVRRLVWGGESSEMDVTGRSESDLFVPSNWTEPVPDSVTSRSEASSQPSSIDPSQDENQDSVDKQERRKKMALFFSWLQRRTVGSITWRNGRMQRRTYFNQGSAMSALAGTRSLLMSSENDDVIDPAMDKEQVLEVDGSIVDMKLIGEDEILKNIEVLTSSNVAAVPSRSSSPTVQRDANGDSLFSSFRWRSFFRRSRDDNAESMDGVEPATLLPLSHPRHYDDRIGRDIRHLTVSIASSVDEAWQWKLLCDDGGGIEPLFQCVREGVRAIEELTKLTFEKVRWPPRERARLRAQHEEDFAAASTACRALRDLCALSPEFSAIVTDEILSSNQESVLSSSLSSEGSVLSKTMTGGLVSNLVTLLQYSNDADNFFKTGMPKPRARLPLRKSLRDEQRRCGLYVLQLFLGMVVASDKAVNTFRSTAGFTDAVAACSSYSTRQRRIANTSEPDMASGGRRPNLAAFGDGERVDKKMGIANRLLASIGYNKWVPKVPGQKGLRILSVDGGGTRGIAAVTSLQAIVDAAGGREVCDSFDMIAGTSTGAIISFLVGIRRDTIVKTREYYNDLISQIFVKSAMSTPMMLFTTASYDEAPFKKIMQEKLGDKAMIDSRADPSVPLIFAVASKMSSTPTHACVFRNYNYNGGEKLDSFLIDPDVARKQLELIGEEDASGNETLTETTETATSTLTGMGQGGSRHPGSFRVMQRAALRASTAAPTVFKPVLMGGELYCDGGCVASNPTAMAVHEARTLFPDVPVELVVSLGTGGYKESKSPPRIGWDGIIGQIADSATDAEQVHHALEDILGNGATAQIRDSSAMSQTRYYRLNPVLGYANEFRVDATDPAILKRIAEITNKYLNLPEQQQKLKEIGDILLCNYRSSKT